MLVIRRSTASGRSKGLITTVVCRGGSMSILLLPRNTHASSFSTTGSAWCSTSCGPAPRGSIDRDNSPCRASTQKAEEPSATAPRSRAFHEPDAVLPASELAVEPLALGGEEIGRRAELGLRSGPRLHRNQQVAQPA